MNKTTAVYCRLALRDAEAIAMQRDPLLRYAGERGYTSLRVYEDNGHSGLTLKRPAFARLEQDIRDGKIERILTECISRLGRNTVDVMKWLKWLRGQGVEIITLDNPTDMIPLLTGGGKEC